jgi:hypothetical protein
MKSLKEWAAVARALESGDQCVILRKGGIMETASGFRVEAERFLIFPTWEHQEEDHVKPEFLGHLRDAKSGMPPEGFNRITSYAEAVEEFDVAGDDTLEGLSGLHIWSDSYLAERAEWMPEKPLRAVFLRVYRIPPVDIPLGPEHRGCRSWVEVDMDPGSGVPVLEDSEAASRLRTFRGAAS